MPKADKDLTSAIKTAEKFHGHLGPFLVLGVRIGKTAQRKPAINENESLEAEVKVPLQPPYSCVIDGIQTTTHCTVGNQRLKIEDTQKQIAATFKLQNAKKSLTVSVSPKLIEELMHKINRGTSLKELAQEIADATEDQLFSIKRR